MSEGEITVRPIDPDSGLVPITQDEAYAWMCARGRCTTLFRDGVLYRVIEPDEAS